MLATADGHVHSEWSWDARLVGSMDEACGKAVEMGLPSIAFTEHVDFTPFRAGFLVGDHPELVEDGILKAPSLDVDGYFDCLGRCRAKYRDLVILAGIEVGQPHRHHQQVSALLASGPFDRVLGSLHCIEDGDEFAEPWEIYPHRPAADVFRDYLSEIPRMVAGSDLFTVFAHIDYPVRSWPEELGPFDPRDFEGEIRVALQSLATSGRALEMNTRLPIDRLFVQWWREEGGESVTFGSDAHMPHLVGTGLADAGDIARAHDFAPPRHVGQPWSIVA